MDEKNVKLRSVEKGLPPMSASSLPPTRCKANSGFGAFLEAYNPSTQYAICADKDACFFGDYPTVGDLRRYGAAAAKTWLYVQLYDLSEYCGCKDKMTQKQIDDCAAIIAMRYPYLKISEIMLYLVNLKAGQYGRFYGAVDPMAITMHLADFLRERAAATDDHQHKMREQQREEHVKRAMSYEEYCKQRQKNKDQR